MLFNTGFAGDWDYWQLYHKVTFDGLNRIIFINFGETAIDFEADIYSAWKEWVRLQTNGKWAAALRTVGGDPLNQDGDRLGATFFLINGWRIQTWDGDHTLTIFGNFVTDDASGLYSDSGGLSADPGFSDRAGTAGVVPTESGKTVQVVNSVSNLVDKINVGGGSGGPFPTAEEIAAAVWDKLISEHDIDGSYGKRLGQKRVQINQGDLIIDID